MTFYNYGNGTALISGVSTFAGTYPLTITASNGTTTVSQSFTLTVGPGTLSFTSAASTTFGINVGGSFTITTTGSPIATSIYLSAGTLPSGVTFYNYGNGTALISGVSTFAGTYPLTITASNGTTTVSQSFTLTIGQGGTTLVFVTQPGGGAAGAIWSQQPVVAVENASNQVVSTDNSTIVYLSIATNPAGGTLSCTGGTSETVVNGYAYFSGCSINLGSASYLHALRHEQPVVDACHQQRVLRRRDDPAQAGHLVQQRARPHAVERLQHHDAEVHDRRQVRDLAVQRAGPALAGQRVNVLVATKVNGVWGQPKYLKSAWANASGVVTFARRLTSAGAINVRIQLLRQPHVRYELLDGRSAPTGSSAALRRPASRRLADHNRRPTIDPGAPPPRGRFTPSGGFACVARPRADAGSR